MTDDLVIHRAPWPDWFAMQDAVRAALVLQQGEQRREGRGRAAAHVGATVAVRMHEDGSGIYFHLFFAVSCGGFRAWLEHAGI